MAKVITFYVPSGYKSKVKYVPLAIRGKVLPFKPMIRRMTITQVLEDVYDYRLK